MSHFIFLFQNHLVKKKIADLPFTVCAGLEEGLNQTHLWGESGGKLKWRKMEAGQSSDKFKRQKKVNSKGCAVEDVTWITRNMWNMEMWTAKLWRPKLTLEPCEQDLVWLLVRHLLSFCGHSVSMESHNHKISHWFIDVVVIIGCFLVNWNKWND